MATPSRETVFSALFALVSTGEGLVGVPTWGSPASSFILTSRRVKLFSDVSAEQQPALFQAEHHETIAQVSGLPYKQTWKADWVVYQKSGVDPNAVPAILNNMILDAVMGALAPKINDIGYPKRNTLGGLVYHCFIDGELFKDPGDIDDQGMMVIPIKLLVP